MDFDLLPDEILANVFDKLSAAQLLELTLVDKRFYDIITSYKFLNEKFVLHLNFKNENIFSNDLHQELLSSSRKFYNLKISNLDYESLNSTKIMLSLLEKFGEAIERFYLEDILIDARVLIAILLLLPNIKHLSINSCIIMNFKDTKLLRMSCLKFRKLETLETKRFMTGDEENSLSVFEFFRCVQTLKNIKIVNTPWKGFQNVLNNQIKLKSLNIYASPGEETFNQKFETKFPFKLTNFNIQADLPEAFHLENFQKFIESQNEIRQIKIHIASSPESGHTSTFNEILTHIFQIPVMESLQLIMFPHNLPIHMLTKSNSNLRSLQIRFIWMETRFISKMVDCFPNLRLLNLQYYGDLETAQVLQINRLQHLEDLSIKRIFGFDLATLKFKNLRKFRCGPLFMLSPENLKDFTLNNPKLRELKIDSLGKSYSINNEMLRIITQNLTLLQCLCLETDKIEKLNANSVKMVLSKCKNINYFELRLPNHTRYLSEFNKDISRIAEISNFSCHIYKGCTDFILVLTRM